MNTNTELFNVAVAAMEKYLIANGWTKDTSNYLWSKPSQTSKFNY